MLWKNLSTMENCQGSSVFFITLIPRLKIHSNYKKYHHVSLIGCVYKIIVKILHYKEKVI